MQTLANAFGLNHDLLLSTYVRAWQSNLQNGVTFMPGAAAFLAWLRDRAIPMALVTSGHRKYVELIDRSLHLTHYFSVIVTADDVERTKPDPEPYVRAVEGLRLPSKVVIGFEDSGPGLRSLIGAGIHSVAVHKHVADRAELHRAALKLTGLDAVTPAQLWAWFQTDTTR